MSMRLLLQNNLRIISSMIFLAGVLIGPCFCNSHNIQARPIQSSQNSKASHCDKSSQENKSIKQSDNTEDCPDCESSEINCLITKDSVFSIKTITIEKNIYFHTVDLDLCYESIKVDFQDFPINVEPPLAQLYRIYCSILE